MIRRFGSFHSAVVPSSLNTTMLAIKVGSRDRLQEISENGIFAYRTPNSMRLVWKWRNFRLMLRTLVLMRNKIVPHSLIVDKDLKEEKTKKERTSWRLPGDSKTSQRSRQRHFNEPFMLATSLSLVTIGSQ